jgi:hypothetical protein
MTYVLAPEFLVKALHSVDAHITGVYSEAAVAEATGAASLAVKHP